MNLKQKYGEWALVCGATDGIGKAFAEYFAANGLSVVLVGRRAEKLQALAEELEQGYGVKAMAVPQDLTADSASENLIKATESLDIGILNYVATFHKMGRYSHAAYPDIQKIIDININTYAKLLHHFYRFVCSAGQRRCCDDDLADRCDSIPLQCGLWSGQSFSAHFDRRRGQRVP